MVDIESTLAEAFIALVDESNFRLLLPVFTWIEVHGSSVIIEKLVKILEKSTADKQDTSLAALIARFALLAGHKRWSTVAKKFTLKLATPLQARLFSDTQYWSQLDFSTEISFVKSRPSRACSPVVPQSQHASLQPRAAKLIVNTVR
jgi:hypothetical protein